MVFTLEQLVFMVEEYVRSESFAKCRIKFAERFPTMTKIPNKSTIHRTVQRFRQTGSVLKKKRSSESNVLTKGALVIVKQFISQNPRVSIKDLSKQCGLNRDTCRLALVKLRADTESQLSQPIPGRSVYSIEPEREKQDKHKRVEYCVYFNENFLSDPSLGDITFYSGEATISIVGEIHTYNMHIPPYFPDISHFKEVGCPPHHEIKIGVWCAISRRRVIGPMYYPANGGMTAQLYEVTLNRFIEQLHDDELQYGYFQHDERPAHVHSKPMKVLEDYYGDRVICNGHWPAQSPDLTMMEFFLWRYIQSQCFLTNPESYDELRRSIERVVSEIPVDTLRNVFDNNNLRVQACLQTAGESFQHLM